MRSFRVLSLAVAVGLVACSSEPTPPAQPAPTPAPDTSAAVGVDALEGKTVVDPSQGPALNESDAVGRALMAKYPVLNVISVDPVPGTNLFEVRTQEWGLRTLGYTTKDIDYVYVNGGLFMERDGVLFDYTRQSLNDRTYRLLEQLPYDQALTFTYGAGERTVVLFEDPDCAQCQQLEAEMDKAGDALNMTVRVLPLPLTQIHPQAEAKWRHILCTANPEAAWNEWMTQPLARGSWELFSQKHPVVAANCARAGSVDKVLDIAGKLGLNQTPVVLFDNGMTFNGRPTLEELEKSLELVARAKAEGAGIHPPAATTPATPAPTAPQGN